MTPSQKLPRDTRLHGSQYVLQPGERFDGRFTLADGSTRDYAVQADTAPIVIDITLSHLTYHER